MVKRFISKICVIGLPVALLTPVLSVLPTAPAAAATTARGTTLGSASYTPPSGAVYVSPSGNDSTGTGTVSNPYKTVAKGIAAAASGGTVVLRAGTYHEAVVIDKALTLQNYPGEVVWFDGSKQLTNWTASGSTWVSTGWTVTHPHMMGGDSALVARYVNSDNPMANYPDMVFVNGTGLTQVSSASAVTSGKFYVDEANDKIVIGTDPTSKEVRASDLEQAIKVTVQGVTLEGFGVRRYATPYELRGAILSDPANGTFRDLSVVDNATIGMAISNSGKVIDHVDVERNGLLGLGSDGADGMKVTNSIFRGNNSENFKTEPVAGGVKITGSDSVLISNNEISNSVDATGLWFDEKSSNAKIVGNSVTNNGVTQIEYEISKNAIIANNIATGGQMGILTFDSENMKVYNNEVGGNSLFGIKVAQDARYQTLADSNFSLKSKTLVYGNNVFGCGKVFQWYALDGDTGISADNMAITINGNLFNKRVVTSDPTMVAWGGADKVTLTRYETPSALAAAKNSSWVNAQTTSCLALSDMSAAISSAQNVAVGLPSDVAAALGVATGYKAVGLIGTVTTTNAKPTASFTATANGLSVAVDGSASADTDGSIASYAWDFGDGTTGTGKTATHTYTSAGSKTITLTVTDNQGAASSAASKSVTLSSTVASDDFSRSATGWGSADLGGAWTLTNGTYYSTNGSVGVVSLAKAGAQGTASLDSLSALNTTTTFTLKVDALATGGGVQHTLQVRRSGTSDYRFTVRFASDSTVRLNLTKLVSGVSTNLGDVKVSGLTYAAGDTLSVKLVTSGSGTTTLSGKVWKVGTTEPSAAQITATDTASALQSAGSIGFIDYLSTTATASATLRMDALRVS